MLNHQARLYLPKQITSKTQDGDEKDQPSDENSWWTRNRTYAFSFFFGASNPKMKKNGRRFRVYFYNEFKNDTSVGGKPIVLRTKTANTPLRRDEYLDYYEDSVFCPVLAGDISWQLRFYDVLACGCIPIVLEWPTSIGADGRTWFVKNKFSVWQTYPFAKGRYGGNNSAIEVDFDLFVLRVPGNERDEKDMSRVRQTLERLLRNEPETIRQMQINLRENIDYITYKLGLEAHSSEDGFHRILKVLARNSKQLAAS